MSKKTKKRVGNYSKNIDNFKGKRKPTLGQTIHGPEYDKKSVTLSLRVTEEIKEKALANGNTPCAIALWENLPRLKKDKN